MYERHITESTDPKGQSSSGSQASANEPQYDAGCSLRPG